MEQLNYTRTYANKSIQKSEKGLVRIIYVSKMHREIDIYCDQVAIATNVLPGHIIEYLEFYAGIHELKIFHTAGNREAMIISQLFEVVLNKQITLFLLDHDTNFNIFSIMDEPYLKHDDFIKIRFINLRDTVEEVNDIIGNQDVVYQIGPSQITPYFYLKSLNEVKVGMLSDLQLSKGEVYTTYLIPYSLRRCENGNVFKDLITVKG